MRKIPAVVFANVDDVPVPHAEARGSLAGLLEALARERIMLVFCSRRTRAQVEGTRQTFGVFHPFVCEGGGAAFVPERYYGADVENTRKVGGYHAVEFAQPYAQVVETLRRAADRLNLGVLGFNDMSVEQVARECGVSLLEARLAKLREYSEPFRLLRANPVAERRLFRALESAGLVCRSGEAFHEVSSAKGPQAAIAVLTTLYRMAFGTVLTAGVRDVAEPEGILPYVDLALDPVAVERSDPQAAQRWLERILHDIDMRRDAGTPARAARLAR